MFQVGEINFCDKIGYNIKTDTKKKEILDNLKNKYDVKIINTHCIKFKEEEAQKYLYQINKQPHLIFLKSNGNPYLFYLTKINEINTVLFIDKKVKQNYYYPRMVITHFNFSDEAFNENIFDGEMIKDDDDNWSFVINNIIVNDGKKVKNTNALDKIQLIDSFLKKNYNRDSLINMCNIYIKKFFCYTTIKDVIDNYIPTLNYSIRGIYFRGLNSNSLDILVDFNKDLIIKDKKEIINHKINMNNLEKDDKLFNLKKTHLPDVYNIYTIEDIFVDIACVNTMKLSKYLYNLFENKTMEDKVLMAFKFSDHFNKFCPIID